MNEFTPELSIVGIVGFLVPFVAQLIKRPTWSSEKRRVVAALVSVVLALVALVGVGAFSSLVISSPQQVVVVCLGVLGVAQLVFTALQAALPDTMKKLEAVGAPESTGPRVIPSVASSTLNTSDERYAEIKPTTEQSWLGNSKPAGEQLEIDLTPPPEGYNNKH